METGTVIIAIQGAGLIIAVVSGYVKLRERLIKIETLLSTCPHVKGQDETPLVRRASTF